MSLTVWAAEDQYSYNQLSDNFRLIDAHRHVPPEGGLPIGSDGIVNEAITKEKIKKGAVEGGSNGNIKSETVTGGEGGDIVKETIDSYDINPSTFNDIVPIGTIINWFRPKSTIALPGGFVIAEGQTLAESEHEFETTGSVTVPDLRNRFVLGASPNGSSNAGPTETPKENTKGGSNSQNLSHTHTIAAHTHGDSHTHGLQAHSHSMTEAGSHHHTFLEGKTFFQRSSAFGEQAVFPGSPNGPYVNLANEAFIKHSQLANGEELELGMENNGSHTHTNSTASGLVTISQSSTVTEPTALTTNTNSELPSDKRPSYYGLLYLIKVKSH